MVLGIILFLLFGFLPVVLALTASPLIAKKNIIFGVTIPEEHREQTEIHQIKRSYLRNSILFSILTLIIFFLLQPFDDKRFATAILVATFLPIIYHTILYLLAYNKVKQLKQQYGWAAKEQVYHTKTAEPNQYNPKPVYSSMWYLIPLVIIFFTMAHMLINYDQIPDRIIIHYDITGKPDGLADKSFMSLFGFSLIQLFLVGMFILMNWVIKNSKKQLDPKNPGRSIQNDVRFRRLGSGFMLLMCIITVVFFSVMQLQMVYELDQRIVSFTVIAELILTTLLIVLFVIRSLRVKKEAFKTETTVTSMDQDSYWKLGGIYYNPNDPALIVEKRMGIGWTLNFARPLSWLILIGPFVLIGILIFFIESSK